MGKILDIDRLEAESISESCFEELPCMAVIERGGMVLERNALTRSLTGYTSAISRLDEVLIGAHDFAAQERRSRFDCLVIRRQGAPMRVSAAAQAWRWRGQDCRLVLLMERAEGMADSSETDGGFLEDVLDASGQATAITHEGRVLHVNREFTRLFGYRGEECVGELLDRLIPPVARDPEHATVEQALATRGHATFETLRRSRLGDPIAVCIVASRVRLGGDARGMFVTYRDIRQQKQHEAKLQHAALHDALTGLANRALFHDRVGLTIARMQRQPGRRFAVVFLDLDGFKKVNDQLGHAAGDGLLRQVADRLVLCLRPQDTIARFGGDEFALLLDETKGLEEVHSVLCRVQAEVRRGTEWEGMQTQVTASMGVALGAPEYRTSEEMLRDADTAMYRAKALGKGQYVVSNRFAQQNRPPMDTIALVDPEWPQC